EFIELYNNTLDDVDLTGWRLTDAIAYQFPQDTTILAGQYLVVAQDSATVQAEFGAAALGPWTGRLDNEGESVVLLDESGIVRDEVDYSNHFPWPVGAQGQGSSMELINPVLANDLGGSWRSSGYDYSESQTTFVPSHSSEWHYRKGISEASDPTDAWRGAGFVEDGTWLTGQTVIGYGDGDDTTLLDDMEDEYSSLYLRHSFQIDSQDDIPGALQLRVYVDDGCIVWINGNEVEPRFYVTGGFKAYNDFAQGHEAGWTQVNVSPGFLVVGENTIAIHALNATLSSSDFSIDAELTGVESTTAGGPSPGQQNNVWALNAAPQVRKVSHGLQQPASGQPATITAKITDPNGVASAMLHYQVVLPGEYIPAYLALTHSELMADPDQPRAENPAFEDPANWTTVAMADNATGGDATAGDDIYTAVIPGRINRTLVRYRITVTDSFGQSARAPYSDDPSLNFAYYVYDGVPDYVAETRSIDPEGAGHVYSSEELTSLPVYSLIARSQDMVEMLAYDSAYQVPQTSDQAIRRAYNWQAAFVYDGVVYDHVDMRLRGANGRYYQAGKRSMRIRFKRGNYLQARDENGVEYPTKWRQLVVSKMFGNKNDANYGLAETVNNEMWNLAGVPAPETHWFHFRVVDGAEEVPSGANAQYYGDFWGMFMAFEPYDVRFLEAHDLPKGNLYKLTNAVSDGNLQQRYQAIDAPTDAEDYNNIRSNLNSSRDEDWLHSYVNYDEWYRYHTVAEAIKHYDYWPGANKNMSWYFEPDETNPMGRLWYLPFDSDASWGPTWNGGEDEAKRAIGGKPEMQMAYRNTIREFRDLIFQPEVIEPWIDRTASVISDFWQADYDRWEDAPSDAGRHSWDGHTLWWKVADMKNFAFVGGSWPGGSVGAGGQAAHLDQLANADGDATSIPYTPSLWYTGPAGFAIDSLVFQCGAFSDPQGDGEFAGMEWRIGEITDPGAPAYDPDAPHAFEYTALWRSGELTSFNDTIAVPGYDLAAGHAYRVRVRMKDTTGRWSHWSAPVQFVAGDADPYIPENLRITELNYHPYEPTAAEISEGYARDQDFEFVELQNTGDRTMDLTRVRFMQGVTFDFTGGGVTSLAPGQRVIVARNSAAFAFRYGPGIAVAGQYVSGLNDTGEQILLVGPYNRAAVEFVWSNSGSWPGKADGKGATLTIVDPAGEYGDPDNWQSSVAYGGTPGESPHAEPGVVVNEVVSHTDEPDVDTIELHNTTDQTVNIGGWFLSDSWGWESNSGNGNYKKFQIPFDTEIGPYGYLLFDEDDFNASGGAGPLDFALNGAHGDDVWLMKADSSGNLTHFADHVDFGAAANGESFGRWPDGQGGPYPMMSVTPGGANSGPRIGPLIITEVMYNPPDPDGAGPMVAGDLEFIELYNPTGQAVELSAWEDNPHTPGQYLADWRIRGGVDVEFDEGATIGAGETLVVLPFDPNIPANAIRLADFRGYYGIDVSVAAVGGYDGLLDGGGDRITLQRPDSPPLEEVNFVPHLLEDEVRYDDQAPWPSIADGGGQSLHRRAPSLWGGDAANWNAAAPNPGMVVFDEPFVLGRHIFYNNSAWDNNNPLPEAFDDDAIAADKLVLLPGQGASAVNYTNYFRGINGVMVDIYALPGDPTTGDFGIRVNEAASPDTWSDGPAPTVSVRAGEGVGGSDRVTLIWADSAILNQWVEVTVLSDGNGGSLGLAENDVFYLGNSIGDCDGNGEVGSSDYGVLVGEFGRRGGIDVLAADVNGDGRVDLSDFATMRGAIGNSVLTPSFPAAAPDAPVAAPGGEAELDVLAIPAAVTSVNPEIMNPETVNPGSASDQSGRLATGNWQLATGEDLTAKPYGNGVAPRHVKAAPGRRTPNNDVAPAVDLLMPSPSPAGYISRPQAISGGSPAATLQRAATGEYDLQPLSDDSLALSESNGETNAPGDDLLADILAESALAVQL
ncbi:MAG: lamin tail domain-containing protein, partial [Phycisphaerae bacterium]|nr:lamin tail domain-containing protein [Phycisphaerae bacterium]